MKNFKKANLLPQEAESSQVSCGLTLKVKEEQLAECANGNQVSTVGFCQKELSECNETKIIINLTFENKILISAYLKNIQPNFTGRVIKYHQVNQELWSWDFPDSPVVKTLPSNAGGTDSIPGWGAEVPHASQSKKIKIKQNKT